MRVTWPARFAAWVDSVGGDVRPLWLSEGGRDALVAFIEGFRLDGIQFAYLARGRTIHGYNVLGVLGTPTLYLVDPGGLVQSGLVGDAFPPINLSRAVCGS
ncbi:MAG TPA: hypothetical protein VJB15_10740 [Rhodothermia bacterium]|nr:hypothetical protein [Rhodothermia bacterium]